MRNRPSITDLRNKGWTSTGKGEFRIWYHAELAPAGATIHRAQYLQYRSDLSALEDVLFEVVVEVKE